MPSRNKARLNLGTCYLKTGNVNGAIEQFEEVVQLRPNSAEANYNLGNAYMRVKKFDEASALFQKALKINPGYRQARAMLEEIQAYQEAGG
jgi:tetratricopeptide (TPR) repeat protein